MITHEHRTLNCPVCGILAVDILVKHTARAKIFEKTCRNGHSFAFESSGAAGLNVIWLCPDNYPSVVTMDETLCFLEQRRTFNGYQEEH